MIHAMETIKFLQDEFDRCFKAMMEEKEKVKQLKLQCDRFNEALGKSYDDYKKLNARALELEQSIESWKQEEQSWAEIDAKRHSRAELLVKTIEWIADKCDCNELCACSSLMKTNAIEALKLYREGK